MLNRFVYEHIIIKSINPRGPRTSPFSKQGIHHHHCVLMGFVPHPRAKPESIPINGSCDVGYEVYVNTFGMQLRPKVSTRPINHSKSGIVWHQHAQGRAPFRLTAILQVNIRCNSNQGYYCRCRLLSAVPEYSRRFIREHHGIDSVRVHNGRTFTSFDLWLSECRRSIIITPASTGDEVDVGSSAATPVHHHRLVSGGVCTSCYKA